MKHLGFLASTLGIYSNYYQNNSDDSDQNEGYRLKESRR